VAVWIGACCSGAESTPDATPSGSAISFKQAAAANKHLFIFFYGEDNEATRTIRTSFEAAMAKMTSAAQWTALSKDAPAEKALVDEFQLRVDPTPWILVLAPNGAVTMCGRAENMPEETLQAAIASPCRQKCLKALQDKKPVVLCVYDKATKDDDPSVKAVSEFKASPYGAVVEVVRVDPADIAETQFLKQMNIDPQRGMTTVVLVPPKRALATFTGTVTKRELDAAMVRFADECG
jgi:hypothetical protein